MGVNASGFCAGAGARTCRATTVSSAAMLFRHGKEEGIITLVLI